MQRFGDKFRIFGITALALSLAAGWPSWGRAQQAQDTEKKEVEAKVKEEAKKEEGPEKPQWNVGVDFLSQYVWRGIGLSRGSGVIQPSVTGSYKGLAVNVWSNIDTYERNRFGINRHRGFTWNETDLTFSYSREVIPNLTLTGGLIYYILDSNNSQFNSVELYGGADYKLPWFNFGFSAYREVSHFPGTYLQWYIHRAIDIPYLVKGMNLDLFASWSAEFSNDKVAYPAPNNKFFQGLDAGMLMATLNIPVGKYVVVAPKIMYFYALGGQSTAVLSGLSWDNKHNHFLGGLNLTVNF